MAQKTLVFTFGRFQPPTRGHAVLFQTLLDVAQKERGDAVLFLSSKQDRKENPLTYEEKRDLVEQAFPRLTIGPKEVKTPILAFAWALEQGYTRALCYVGGARDEDFRRMIDRWQANTPNSEQIAIDLRGIPRTGAMDPKAVSGTTARRYAQEGNFEEFQRILVPGIPPQHAKDVMKTIQERLGPVVESTGYMSFASFIEPLLEADDPEDQVLQQASQDAEDKDTSLPQPDDVPVSADDLPKKIAQQKGSIDAREAERVPSDIPSNQSKLVIHPDARLKKTMATNLQRWKENRETVEESFTAEELIARC